MPNRDMTGPMGQGPMTGQGLGQMPAMTGMPPGDMAGMPIGGDVGMPPGEGEGTGNPEQEYEQVVAQMPQEKRDEIVQGVNQDAEATIEGLARQILQLEQVGDDMAGALNMAKTLVEKVLVFEMMRTGKTLSELCPDLEAQIEQPEEGEVQPAQPGTAPGPGMPGTQPPPPSVLGGGV